MNLDQFSTVVDDRRYINPQVALDESNAFIENLRNTQGQRTAEIAQDTYNLGTAVPSNLGGLGGSGSYFTSRYQTPQTNEIVANLKATAQAQALNDAMNNALAQAKQRYNKAYSSYQKRRNNGGGGGTGGTNPKGNVNYNPSDLPDEKKAPDINDYIDNGTKFGKLGSLYGYAKKFPMSVDGPIVSTDFETYTHGIKSEQEKSDAWVKYLDSIGYGG